ncbi:hypothetical protein EMPS_09503 [Entomortierella parvispora]|uniref:SUN domain-containing protein n=1 Tax=Entomortierella parvispora TaxID=205924 RepID=A0A9P3HI43_9FUNG|nr:hypothetical protein EMPS_09503 [Entomortierella parvispora]
MGRRATPTPPPTLAPQSRYFLRNSTLTPEPTFKKEFSLTPSRSPSPQCHDELSLHIPRQPNHQLYHPTGVSVQDTKSGMYARLGTFANNQTHHHYDIDDSPAYDWSSTSDVNDDGNTFSDEDAMVAFLERQELELSSGFAIHSNEEKSLWPVQTTSSRARNIPLLSHTRGPHSELPLKFGNESELAYANTSSKVEKNRLSRRTHSTKRRHRGSSFKRASSPPLERLALGPLIGFTFFVVLFVVTVFSLARKHNHQAYTLHGGERDSSQSLQKEWTWAWMTRPRAKDDRLLTLQYVQDLEHKLEHVQRILERLEVGNTGPSEPDHLRAPLFKPNIFSTLETKAITDMIEEALGADIVAKPDFALYSVGGRVLPHLTFANLVQLRQPTLLGRLGGRFLVPPPTVLESKSPEKALQPSVFAGECWAFQGDHGQLGIQLSRRITVTDVTIEHVDHRAALDIGSAPRHIEIWRLTEPGPRRSAPPQSSSFEMHPPPPQHQNSKETGKTVPLSSIKGIWRNGNAPVPGATLLTSFEYQIKNNTDGNVKRVQTFSIPERKQDEISTGIVVRVLSNWGHAKHTCLYRVRVHGLEQ